MLFLFQGPYHLISSQPGGKYLDNWGKFPDILPSISILYQTLQFIKTVLIYPSRCFTILFFLCRTVLCFWIQRLAMCLITLYSYFNRSLAFLLTDKEVKWFTKNTYRTSTSYTGTVLGHLEQEYFLLEKVEHCTGITMAQMLFNYIISFCIVQ